MGRVIIQWQVGEREAADFFLYREGDEVHSDHRQYSREELERRVGAIASGSGDVPLYYRLALEALADPQGPSSGTVTLEEGTV